MAFGIRAAIVNLNLTLLGRGDSLFGFLPFTKSPAFAPFCPFSGDSSASVCFCSPLPLLLTLFQARLSHPSHSHENYANRAIDFATEVGTSLRAVHASAYK